MRGGARAGRRRVRGAPDQGSERIRREARVVGLRGFQTPSLEAVERRRMQLWFVAAFLLVALAVGAAVLSAAPRSGLESVVTPNVLRGGLVALALAFGAYAIEKEHHLRRLARLLTDERVLSTALSNRLHEVSTLLEAGKAMNAVLELPAVLDIILRSAVDLLGGKSGSLMLLENGDELLAACVFENDAVRGRRSKVGTGIAGHVALTREPLIIEGEASPDDFPGLRHRQQDVDSAMSVPLMHRGELLGVLNVNADAGRVFTEYDLRAIALFAEQGAGAIANARLYECERDHVARLVEIDRQKAEFIAMVTHELRSPATAILSASQTLQRPEMSENHGEIASIIERQARRLAGMVNELLDSVRAEREQSEVVLEAVDLGALVRDAARELELAGRHVDVEGPGSAPVNGDADGLRRVLDNLVDNAFKYGSAPIRILLEARGDHVVFSVLDSGSGVPPEEREHVFARFARLATPEERRKLPGLGLGLSIVKGIVNLCGGTIWVDDAPGGGAAFRVSLPVALAVEAGA